ncbi:MAG: hypothetical protein WCK15_23750 [Pirellula sp.]
MAVDWEVVKILSGVLGGGAVGAVITNVVTSYRNRVQPVGHRITVSPLFSPNLRDTVIRPVVSVQVGDERLDFANLFVAEVQVLNRGNRDFDSFTFGISLKDGDSAIHAENTTPNRFHLAEISTPPSVSTPKGHLDITLRPFNRADLYEFKLFMTTTNAEPGKIDLATAHPIRFVEVPSLTETLFDIASTYSVSLGPIQIRLR